MRHSYNITSKRVARQMTNIRWTTLSRKSQIDSAIGKKIARIDTWTHAMHVETRWGCKEEKQSSTFAPRRRGKHNNHEFNIAT